MSIFFIELKAVLRSLARSPGFTVMAVLVLGLGLGVNTILFNTVHALLWRPLGFSQPQQLATLRCSWPGPAPSNNISIGDAVCLREQVDCLEAVGLADCNAQGISPMIEGRRLDLNSIQVNSGYFRALKLKPLMGRFFGAEEDVEGDFSSGQGVQHQALEVRGVLTESCWRHRFGADPSVIGRALPLEEGRSLRILGVVPGGSTLPFVDRADLLVPLPWMHPDLKTDKNSYNYPNVLRVKSGVSLTQASERMKAAIRASDVGGSWFRHQMRFWGDPLRVALVPEDQRPIFLLAAAAALLLVLICANVASLFLVRILRRSSVTALRLALGATRMQAVRPHFLEALLVCGVGTGLALLINHLARPLVLEFLPELRRVGPELLDTGSTLLLFSLIVCFLITLLILWISIFQSGNARLSETLAQGGMRGSARGSAWRVVLISTQVAVIVVLLSMGGLAWHSLFRALHSHDDFDLKGVMAVEFTLPEGHREDRALVQTVMDHAAHLPGTQNLGLAEMIPCGGSHSRATFSNLKGHLQAQMYARQRIGDGYFATLRTPLIEGREFTREESLHRDPLVILSESMARIFFKEQNPLGQTIYGGDRPFTVVGVVKDSRFRAMDEAPEPMVFLNDDRAVTRLLVRTSAASASFESALKQQISKDPSGIQIERIRPMQTYAEKSVVARTHASILVGGFALLGLLVGSVGLYGTLSAQVQQQRRELGIRMALGAPGSQIVMRTLMQGTRWILPGVIAGACASLMAAQAIRHVLYGVLPLDGLAFVAALLLLLMVAFLACLSPSLRAARVEPNRALREE